MPQVISAASIDDAANRGLTTFDAPAHAVITASARDRARARGITITQSAATPTPTAAQPARRWSPDPQPTRTWQRPDSQATTPARTWQRPTPNFQTSNSQTAPKALPQLADFDRVRDALRRNQLDAIVCALPFNVFYLSGFDCEPLWEMVPYAYVIFPATGEPALVTSSLQLSRAVEFDLWIKDVWPSTQSDPIVFDTSAMLEMEKAIKEYKESLAPRASTSHAEAIMKVLADRRLLAGRLGFDDMRVPLRLPQPVNAVEAVDVMREVRMIKNPAEIVKMREAAVANEEAALDAVRMIPRLRTWDDVVDRYKANMALRHAEAKYLVGGVQHDMATFQTDKSYALRRGDFFMIDALGAKDHYYGDFGRAGSWGPVDPAVRKRYDALRKGLWAGMEAARPGALFRDVNEIVRDTIRREGNTNQRLAGLHSVGLEHTDMPRRPDMRVQANMTMNFDIGYMEAGFGAVHLEDTFVVTDNGYDLLTSGKNEWITV